MRGSGGIGFLAAALAGALCTLLEPWRAAPVRPWPGSPIPLSLAGGESARFELDLEAGEFVAWSVEQRGLDVALAWLGPDGRQLLAKDSPNDDWGEETLACVAKQRGRYRLEVRSAAGTARGSCRVELRERREALPADRLRASAESLYALAERGRREGRWADALPRYAQARGLWQQSEDPGSQAWAWVRQAQVLEALARPLEALEAWQQAETLERAQAARQELAAVLVNQADLLRRQRRFDPAQAALAQAQALFAALGDRRREATALADLGLLRASEGDLEGAIAHYREASERFAALEAWAPEATVQTNLGWVLSDLGHFGPAEEAFERALKLAREARAGPSSQAEAWRGLGNLARRRGQGGAALAAFGRALEAAGPRATAARALALNGLALTRAGLGQTERARSLLCEVGELARVLGSPRLAAYAELNRGWLESTGGAPGEARALLSRALDALAKLGDLQGEAAALYLLAQVERAEGGLPAALQAARASLARVEQIRGSVASEVLRSSFLARRRDHYDLLVELLMDAWQRQGDVRLAEEALEVSERCRARGLLDELAPRTAQPQGPAPAVDGVPGGGASTAEMAAALDAGTVLLEIHLGEARSFAWLLESSGALTPASLPGRASLEPLARRAREWLAASEFGPARELAERALAQLGEHLLGPFTSRLRKAQRLLAVADGALLTLPFATLSWPGATAYQPLLLSHEVVHEPSMTTLLRLRERAPSRASGVLAVVGAPSWEGDGPMESPGPSRLALPRAEGEARAILALAPESRRLARLGAEARLSNILGGELGGYQLVHFATHGLIQEEDPSRSGLLLARRRGESLEEATLTARQIASLELPAELVVLSACRSQLGRELPGEGLLGLPNAFFRAGARRLLVSSWDVGDADAAELMPRFYRGLLRQELSPAAALRQAQLALYTQPSRAAPAHWGAWVLLGAFR